MDEPIFTPAVNLTPRQIQTVSWAALGYKAREIATLMFIDRRTVEFHLACVYSQLGVNNQVRAINKVRELGLLIEDEDHLRALAAN